MDCANASRRRRDSISCSRAANCPSGTPVAPCGGDRRLPPGTRHADIAAPLSTAPRTRRAGPKEVCMVTASVQEFLRRGNVSYTVFQHVPAFSAQAEAAVAHVPGRDWAKAVVCFADGEPIQAVVPADREVDLPRLAAVARAA